MIKTKKKSTRSDRPSAQSFDGTYLLKMVLYLLMGSVWIKISNATDINIPIPIGLILGLVFTAHEHFRIDRKMEYVILLSAMLFGYFAPYGLYVSF